MSGEVKQIQIVKKICRKCYKMVTLKGTNIPDNYICNTCLCNTIDNTIAPTINGQTCNNVVIKAKR